MQRMERGCSGELVRTIVFLLSDDGRHSLQLVANRDADQRLLAAAAWGEEVIEFSFSPPRRR